MRGNDYKYGPAFKPSKEASDYKREGKEHGENIRSNMVHSEVLNKF